MPALILRDGLLAGVTVIVAGPAPAIHERCERLGARVVPLAVDPHGDEPDPPQASAPVLVWDGPAAFASADPGVSAVRAALDGAWLAVRPVAEASMIAGEAGGKVVLLAPPPGGPHAEAARAGLENLSRTLGIEWARFGIRTVTILPGRDTDAADVAEIVAYLASPAGDYFSGCALTLGAAG